MRGMENRCQYSSKCLGCLEFLNRTGLTRAIELPWHQCITGILECCIEFDLEEVEKGLRARVPYVPEPAGETGLSRN